jgi:Aromatic-ring-opening dioxygenase LigAB, LigA subunit
MSAMEAHYFFPPASAYPLNRFLFALKSDTAVRERYVADPEATMRAHGLDDDVRAALAAGDRDRLVTLGGHPYLVFMAQVRLSMAREPGSFEYF